MKIPVKCLLSINFLPHRTAGYWEDQGYEWFAAV
jgi:DMSO/TMAO reductase YedYZ molybdopterin-dependent catalytic subunit